MNYPSEPAIAAWLAAGIARTTDTMQRLAPRMAAQVVPWLRALSPGAQPEAYFLHPRAFPMVQLPYWLAGTPGGAPGGVPGGAPDGRSDDALHRELAYSCVNIYYFIRLIDDVMDGAENARPLLLPAAGYFHTQWHGVFARLFPAGHPFWEAFERLWFETCEIVLHDAHQPATPLDWFLIGPGRKVHGAKIPLLAAAYHCGALERYAAWLPFFDRFAQWHQMFDDVIDWANDLRAGHSSYFLTEGAARKAQDETLAQWVAREGFAWGVATLHTWFAEVRALAAGLGAGELLTYLDWRQMLLLQDTAAMEQRLKALAALLTAVAYGNDLQH